MTTEREMYFTLFVVGIVTGLVMALCIALLFM